MTGELMSVIGEGFEIGTFGYKYTVIDEATGQVIDIFETLAEAIALVRELISR